MNIESIIKRIDYMQERLSLAENNLQYIKRVKALKYWLDKFDTALTPQQRIDGEYSNQYIAYFFTGCGFSLYEKVCNSILDYQYGNRPF